MTPRDLKTHEDVMARGCASIQDGSEVVAAMRVSLATFPHLSLGLLLRLRPGSNIVGSIMGGSRN